MEKAVVNFRMDKTTKKEMEEICEDIGISKNSLTFIKGNSYESTGGIINTNHRCRNITKEHMYILSKKVNYDS